MNTTEEIHGCRSLICDSNGIIIAETVYRCMLCASIVDSVYNAQKHYHIKHNPTQSQSAQLKRKPEPPNITIKKMREPEPSIKDEDFEITEDEDTIFDEDLQSNDSTGYCTCPLDGSSHCKSCRLQAIIQYESEQPSPPPLPRAPPIKYHQNNHQAQRNHQSSHQTLNNHHIVSNHHSNSSHQNHATHHNQMIHHNNQERRLKPSIPAQRSSQHHQQHRPPPNQPHKVVVNSRPTHSPQSQQVQRSTPPTLQSTTPPTVPPITIKRPQTNSANSQSTTPSRSRPAHSNGSSSRNRHSNGGSGGAAVSPPAASPEADDTAAMLVAASAVRSGGKKNWGCRKCAGCTVEDCGKCNYCLDKPKFGGPNTLKKKCIQRRCLIMPETPRSR